MVGLVQRLVPGHVATVDDAELCTKRSGERIIEAWQNGNQSIIVLQDGEQVEMNAPYQFVLVHVRMAGGVSVLSDANVPLDGKGLNAEPTKMSALRRTVAANITVLIDQVATFALVIRDTTLLEANVKTLMNAVARTAVSKNVSTSLGPIRVLVTWDIDSSTTR